MENNKNFSCIKEQLQNLTQLILLDQTRKKSTKYNAKASQVYRK